MHILLAEDEQKSRAYGDQVTACASAESALDSSERKHAEEALRESEATWRSLTEHSPDHIMLLDREARILFINHTVPDLNKEQVVGTPVYDYVPATFRPNMQACFERVFNSGQPGSYDTEYHDRDDKIHVFESHVGPVMQEDQVTALMVRSTDITDRRRVEEELERYHTESI